MALGNSKNWILKYPSDKSQFVQFENRTSFLIYVNHIAEATNVSILSFADDKYF